MTINYRRSVDPMSQTGRHYLSDSLTPWWGYWLCATPITIAFDNLPPQGDIIARLEGTSAGTSCWFRLTLNDFLNLKNYSVGLWTKCSAAAQSLRLFIGTDTGLGFATNYYWIYTGGSAPTSWDYKSFNLTDTLPYPPTSYVSRDIAISRVKYLIFYFTTSVGDKIETAGVNIRRLP